MTRVNKASGQTQAQEEPKQVSVEVEDNDFNSIRKQIDFGKESVNNSSKQSRKKKEKKSKKELRMSVEQLQLFNDQSVEQQDKPNSRNTSIDASKEMLLKQLHEVLLANDKLKSKVG